MNQRFPYAAGLIVLVMLACNFPLAALIPGSDSPAPTPSSDLPAPTSTSDSPVPTPGSTIELPATDTQAADGSDFILEIVSIDNTTIVRAREPWTWVYYRVTNVGTVAFPDNIHMQSFSNGVANSGYINVEGPFEPGVPVDGQVAVAHDDTWALGDYTYSMVVDYDGLANENNEANNSSASITFTVVAP